jgi:hypothetical protein
MHLAIAVSYWPGIALRVPQSDLGAKTSILATRFYQNSAMFCAPQCSVYTRSIAAFRRATIKMHEF